MQLFCLSECNTAPQISLYYLFIRTINFILSYLILSYHQQTSEHIWYECGDRQTQVTMMMMMMMMMMTVHLYCAKRAPCTACSRCRVGGDPLCSTTGWWGDARLIERRTQDSMTWGSNPIRRTRKTCQFFRVKNVVLTCCRCAQPRCAYIIMCIGMITYTCWTSCSPCQCSVDYANINRPSMH